jgi:hypothetical protein
MKTKITSIALLVLAGLFTSTESVKAYINMPDDLTWDASVGIFPVITQPAAAYYTAQRAYESAKSAYDPAKSAYDSAKSAYDSAKSAYDSAKSTYDSANISPEAALSSYQATLSAYQDAEAYYIWSYINDPGSARASYDAYVAAAATRYSAEATYNIFLGNYEAYNTTQAAYNATQTVYNATQAVYNESISTLRASVSSANAVPEPSTYGLIGIGALSVAFAARRRKVKAV